MPVSEFHRQMAAHVAAPRIGSQDRNSPIYPASGRAKSRQNGQFLSESGPWPPIMRELITASPSAEVREALAGFHPGFLAQAVSFDPETPNR
jgi:hypothetical protein